ncbi:hypothetical protein MP638_002289, partial [Amoeboaphelidium occidentale]
MTTKMFHNNWFTKNPFTILDIEGDESPKDLASGAEQTTGDLGGNSPACHSASGLVSQYPIVFSETVASSSLFTSNAAS